MPVLAPPHRLALGLAGALVLAGCGGAVDLTIERDLAIDTSLGGGAVLTSYDLSTAAGSAWRERSRIDAVHVGAAEATLRDVATPGVALSGSVWLIPEAGTGPDAPGSVEVGTWTAEPVTDGHVISLTLSPALDAFVLAALRGSGKFGLYAAGAGAGGARVACTLHVVLGATVKLSAR
jgi:hypothetical protein